jgi:DNA-binding transcriptional LysR family regulator
MDLRDLRYVVAIAEEGSLTRAAARLHMTQPPLSAHLQDLERRLGSRLFVRHRRGVDLTEAGQHLLPRAVRLLGEVEALERSVRSVGQGTAGRLAVAFDPALARPLVTPLLTKVRAQLPDLDLDPFEAAPDEATAAVRAHHADAALLYAPVTTRDFEGLEVAVVAREPMVAVIPASRPVPAGPIDLATLRAEPFIAPARAGAAGLHTHLLAACRLAGFSPVAVRECRSVDTAIALVAAGLGVSALPAGLRTIAGPEVTLVPLSRPVHVVESVVTWDPTETAPALHRFLRIALATPEPDVLGPDKARRTPHSPDDSP